MKVKSSFLQRFLNILFWSVLSAAFIGPGTLTTASQAGASFKLHLLWALSFSTLACIVLQEASARIKIISGLNLGQAIRQRFPGKSSQIGIKEFILGGIVLGSAAYQAGNIMGAVAGVQLVASWPKAWIVTLLSVLAFLILNIPSLQIIARILGAVVAFMGILFFSTAALIAPSWGELFYSAWVPHIPSGSGLLILGLVGTTVVPYNLFLGSGVSSKKQSLSEMRFGLSMAILLGGLISMAVLVVGTIVNDPFTFARLAEALSEKLGGWATYALAGGMLAAGLSSAITAPLASAITAQSLFQQSGNSRWSTQSWYFKAVWGFVWGVGFAFSLANVKPIPAIILAQALNGLLLPFISIFLVFVVNDPKLVGKEGLNSRLNNFFLGLVVMLSAWIGIMNIVKAIRAISSEAFLAGQMGTIIIVATVLLLNTWMWLYIYKGRKS